MHSNLEMALLGYAFEVKCYCRRQIPYIVSQHMQAADMTKFQILQSNLLPLPGRLPLTFKGSGIRVKPLLTGMCKEQ